MADPIPQRLVFSDELDKPARFRVEAGYITALLLQGQPSPIVDKFARTAPKVEAWLRTGTWPAQ